MRKIVIPTRPDLLVPDPGRGDNLPAQGRLVDWNVYWARREVDGSVQVKSPQESPAKVSKEPERTKESKE